MAFKKKWAFAAALILIAAIALTSIYVLLTQSNSNQLQNAGTLFQVSAYYPMSLGNYEGIITYGDLKIHGDFGIGAFNNMDGEMIALNGIFYQVRTDGVPRIVNSSLKSPFAMVTFFKIDQTFQVDAGLNYSQLTAYIDSFLPSENGIYAIKVHGTYDYAKTRSIPAQNKPYPALAEVVGNQTVFVLNDVAGTAVGYRCPSYMNGTDVPGYHLHFLTDNHNAGGHLLDCITRTVTIEIGHINTFEMAVPAS